MFLIHKELNQQYIGRCFQFESPKSNNLSFKSIQLIISLIIDSSYTCRLDLLKEEMSSISCAIILIFALNLCTFGKQISHFKNLEIDNSFHVFLGCGIRVPSNRNRVNNLNVVNIENNKFSCIECNSKSNPDCLLMPNQTNTCISPSNECFISAHMDYILRGCIVHIRELYTSN